VNHKFLDRPRPQTQSINSAILVVKAAVFV